MSTVGDDFGRLKRVLGSEPLLRSALSDWRTTTLMHTPPKGPFDRAQLAERLRGLQPQHGWLCLTDRILVVTDGGGYELREGVFERLRHWTLDHMLEAAPVLQAEFVGTSEGASVAAAVRHLGDEDWLLAELREGTTDGEPAIARDHHSMLVDEAGWIRHRVYWQLRERPDGIVCYRPTACTLLGIEFEDRP